MATRQESWEEYKRLKKQRAKRISNLKQIIEAIDNIYKHCKLITYHIFLTWKYHINKFLTSS